MNGAGVEIDISKVREMFKDLTGKEMQKAEKTAVRQGASILKRATDRAYRNSTNLASRKTKSGEKGKPGKSKISYNRRTGVYKVHIMADYVMKWFEKGTRPRTIKNPTTLLVHGRKGDVIIGGKKRAVSKNSVKYFPSRLSGRIRPLFLFKRAREGSEQRIFSGMRERLEKAIKKINDKKR